MKTNREKIVECLENVYVSLINKYDIIRVKLDGLKRKDGMFVDPETAAPFLSVSTPSYIDTVGDTELESQHILDAILAQVKKVGACEGDKLYTIASLGFYEKEDTVLFCFDFCYPLANNPHLSKMFSKLSL